MSRRKSLLAPRTVAAVFSSAALATGMSFAAAPAANASLDLMGSSELADSLDSAAEALYSPVSVQGSALDGPAVAYTNRTDAAQGCLGFTFPYSTVDELGIDPSATDFADVTEAIAFVQGIEAAGGVSLLGHDGAGAPDSLPDPTPGAENNTDIVSLISDLALSGPTEDNSVQVAPGQSVFWDAPDWAEGDEVPEGPSAAVVICMPYVEEGETAEMDISFGVDPQVVADQINERLQLDLVTAGSIGGASVEQGGNLLGSAGGLLSGGADDAENGGEAETEGLSGSSIS